MLGHSLLILIPIAWLAATAVTVAACKVAAHADLVESQWRASLGRDPSTASGHAERGERAAPDTLLAPRSAAALRLAALRHAAERRGQIGLASAPARRVPNLILDAYGAEVPAIALRGGRSGSGCSVTGPARRHDRRAGAVRATATTRALTAARVAPPRA